MKDKDAYTADEVKDLCKKAFDTGRRVERSQWSGEKPHDAYWRGYTDGCHDLTGGPGGAEPVTKGNLYLVK